MTDAPNGQKPMEEGQPPVELPPTEKPAEVSVPPTDAPEGTLPEGVKERTAQEFEKLKEHNRLMAEKLRAYEAEEAQKRTSALDLFAPVTGQPVNNPPVSGTPQSVTKTEDIKPVVPDENGMVDINVLNRTIEQINEKARRSEEAAKKAIEEAKKADERVSKFEHTDKTLKTYAVHPYLDPTRAEYDKKFSDLTKLEILRQLTEEGKADYLAAANKVKEQFYDPMNKPTPPVDPKTQENVAKREQINAMSGGKQSESTVDQENLVNRTRLGDRDALYQRLKKSGY